jgi:hypothetical protein
LPKPHQRPVGYLAANNGVVLRFPPLRGRLAQAGGCTRPLQFIAELLTPVEDT